MELIECLRARKSCRFFERTLLDIDEVKNIISEALLCPSGKGLRPWKIHIISNKEETSLLASESTINKWLRSAPIVLVIMLDKAKKYDLKCDYLGCGALIENILLSARNHQIDSCWIGEHDLCSETIGEKLLIDTSSYEIVSYVALGYSHLRIEKSNSSIELCDYVV